VRKFIEQFLRSAPESAGKIYNERALQLELAYFLRLQRYVVEFERPFKVESPPGSTRKPKTKLDLIVYNGDKKTAIELKVPLNRQHPETLYQYCADIEFVEALVRAGVADCGFCLLITNDHNFWKDSGQGSDIHNLFRCSGEKLTGIIQKPTKPRNTQIVLTGEYEVYDHWCDVGDIRLMKQARYLLLEIW